MKINKNSHRKPTADFRLSFELSNNGNLTLLIKEHYYTIIKMDRGFITTGCGRTSGTKIFGTIDEAFCHIEDYLVMRKLM